MATPIYNIVLVKNSLQVTIATRQDEETGVKIISPLTFPTTSAKWENGPKTTKIVDLLRIEKRVTYNGYLSNNLNPDSGTGLSNDTSQTAEGKKADFKSIFEAGGVVTVYAADGTTFTANFDKYSIKRIVSDGQSNNYDEAEFEIMFTVVKGVDL